MNSLARKQPTCEEKKVITYFVQQACRVLVQRDLWKFVGPFRGKMVVSNKIFLHIVHWIQVYIQYMEAEAAIG